MDFLKSLFKFVMMRKKYWLFPVIVLLALLGLLFMLSGSVVAPFIYTLF